jgi:ABC-type transport system involved in cytochrome c biogenesis permease subunit
MSTNVLRLAAALYAVAAVAYVLFFARQRHARLATAGKALVAAGLFVHTISIGIACGEFGGAEFFNLRGGLGMLAWAGSLAFLLLQRRYRIPSIGAFVLPLVLVAVLPGVFGTGPNAPWVIPQSIRTPSLTVHIFSAMGGVAIFAIAFVVAVMYLLQEREVKGKHFGALFSRLPSLDALDRLTQRLVRSGFVVYTVALVTGTFVAKRAWGASWSWDPQQVASLIVWLLYGVMVQLRYLGIHGRRYALLTLAGFALVMTSMVGLGVLPNATRHGGNFQ